ncbi:immunoglobulin-like domain-containing protein [Jeotgalicoccus sp. S0W5]|uniref:immunoglobulin-like domain-containing protein n=1 Tax=Jeotgalicoccus sp. S0W5 TaxID=2527874 RepID=UPI00141508AC|nr:immunoglobulin-like domain-containing protein [Jeotgalicoccus sp. S0W5]
MNSKNLIKFMIGILPLAPAVNTYLDQDTEQNTSEETPEDYNGPTMEEEINNHTGNLPAIKNVENVNVQNGDDFDPLQGVYAVDNTDGNLTEEIEVTENNVNTSQNGTYNVSYRVENSNGGYYTYVRVITVSDAPSDSLPQVPPSDGSSESDNENSNESNNAEVLFEGVDDLTITAGEEFDAKSGVRVTDVDGTDISDQLYISGEVDTQTPGEYTIAYAVFDIFGNPNAVGRTVTVQ